MCVIIDANVARRVLLVIDDPDFKDVHAALFDPRHTKVKLVYGGKLSNEYARVHEIRRIVATLDRAGRAIKVDDDMVNQETANVSNSRLCISDDPHIIALALVSNVRLLCSHDRDLHTDFTNKTLLDKPRGKVYQTAKHVDLLRRFCG